ncbi:hypothetical protein VTJ04DRAFT_4837 [Mycothermus thermophilus]|uniref:uncharacterized protein n=1 Tax=Humicola insolens TaxID=85995 RepID=UPI0037436B6B
MSATVNSTTADSALCPNNPTCHAESICWTRWILGFIGVDPLVAPGEVFTSTCQAPAKSLSTVATLADHPYHLGSQRPALYPTQIIQSKKRIGLTSRIAVIAG